MLSRIKLKQQGTVTIRNLKKYETIIAATITNKIRHETLRKYLNSFSESGFSGVSSGLKTNMQTEESMVINKRTV